MVTRVRFTPDGARNFQVQRPGVDAQTDDPDALGLPWEAVNLAVLDPEEWVVVGILA